MLLKIFCKNILPFVISYFYIIFPFCFFLFFSLVFSPTTHVYPYISILSFSFFTFHLFQNLPLSFFFQLSRHLFLCEDQPLSFPNQFQISGSILFQHTFLKIIILLTVSLNHIQNLSYCTHYSSFIIPISLHLNLIFLSFFYSSF